MAFEKLKKSPLVEAVCEFRFSDDLAWDWTVPGILYEKVKVEFSERAQLEGMALSVQLSPKSPQPPVIQSGPERIQFKRKDGKAMLQIGPRMLAINCFPPYSGWEDFREVIRRMYAEYVQILGGNALRQLGLRYINRIDFPQSGSAFGDFITLEPPLRGSLTKPVSTFFQRYELTIDEPMAALIHQSGLQKVGEQWMLVIDLDFVSNRVADLKSAQSVFAWLDSAHSNIHSAFVDSLNPDLYRRLKDGDK